MTGLDRIADIVSANARYYGKDIDEVTFAFYLKDLAQYGPELVSKAFEAHRNNPDAGKFMPRVSDVVREIQAMTSIDDGMRAVGAWEQVLHSFRTASPPSFSPEILAALSCVGGINRIRMAKEGTDLEFARKEFVEAYKTISKTSRRDSALPGATRPQIETRRTQNDDQD